MDIFKSDSLKVPKLPFRLSLRATNSLATATRQSLSVLCLWMFSIVSSVLTEDGAFALFFRPHPGGFDSSRVPTPGNLLSKAKKNTYALAGRTRYIFPTALKRIFKFFLKSMRKVTRQGRQTEVIVPVPFGWECRRESSRRRCVVPIFSAAESLKK